MKLSTARLCLDCNEVYDEAVCPGCGSETFAYLTRWVPTGDQHPQPRPASSPTADAYRGLLAPRAGTGWSAVVGNALVGAAAIGTLGWIWHSRTKANGDNQSATEAPPPASDEKVR